MLYNHGMLYDAENNKIKFETDILVYSIRFDISCQKSLEKYGNVT